MHYSVPISGIERKKTTADKWIVVAASYSLLCLALLSAMLTLLGIYQLSWTGPFRDIWEFIAHIQQQLNGQWSLSYLLDAYGGAHRILLPKLIFWADYRYFYGSNLLTIALSLLCQCLSLFLCWQLWRNTTLPIAMRLCLLSGMMAALFHAGQLFNFLYAMDVQWFMSNTFALIALTIAANAQHQRQHWLALLFAVCASLCNFTGLMAVAILAIFSLCYRRKHRLPVSYYVFTASCGAYLLWYVKTGKSNENFILARFLNSETLEQFVFNTADTLINLVPFTLKMLSNPLSREWPLVGSLVALISILFLLQQTLQLRHSSNPAQRTAVMWCWYIILGCTFTALGRIFYPNSAVAERYLTLTLPYTVLIIALIFLQCRSIKQQTLAALILSPLALYFYGSSSIDSFEKMTVTSEQQHIAQAAARTQVLALDQIRGTLSFPMANKGHNAVAEFNTWLDEKNVAYFHSAPFYRLHDTWTSVLARWPSSQLPVCTGHISQQHHLQQNQQRIEGQLLDSTSAAHHLLFSNGVEIIGFGYNRQPAANWLPWRQHSVNAWHFVGFINGTQPPQSYQVLGMTRQGVPICYATIATASP